ncbi:MAG TPA: alpha/beta fold hydrolase, partial [Clostridiaceae bacterium]|nr:alpha/beta fold hydrolase [Clostridiaceae bacterium]
MLMELAHRYRKGGSELILFIHGIVCSKESFEQVWGIPEFEKYSLLTADLAGHGDSPRPAGFSYSMEAQADACMHLLQSFEFDRIHIAGHSMGGAVALLLAGKLEDKLGSFISVEGNLIGADCGLVTRKTISYDLDEFEKVKFGRFVENNETSEDTSLKLWAGMLRKCSSLAFYKSSESLVKWSDSGRLLEIFLRLNSRKAYIHGDRNSKTDVLGKLKGRDKI